MLKFESDFVRHVNIFHCQLRNEVTGYSLYQRDLLNFEASFLCKSKKICGFYGQKFEYFLAEICKFSAYTLIKWNIMKSTFMSTIWYFCMHLGFYFIWNTHITSCKTIWKSLWGTISNAFNVFDSKRSKILQERFLRFGLFVKLSFASISFDIMA